MKKYILLDFIFFTFSFFTIANANSNEFGCYDGSVFSETTKGFCGPISSENIKIHNNKIFIYKDGFWTKTKQIYEKDGYLYAKSEDWVCTRCRFENSGARYKCRNCKILREDYDEIDYVIP